MSVIARQGFKYTVIGYIGFLIGTLSIFLFQLDFEFYGTLRFILTTAELLAAAAIFGISYSNIKFYPRTKAEGKHQNILSLSLLAVLINFLVVVMVFFIGAQLFPNIKNWKIWEFKLYIFPLVLLLSWAAVLNRYISNYKKIAFPNVLENLFPKLANVTAFSLGVFAGFPMRWTLLIFISFFILALFFYLFYNNRLEKFQFNFNTDFINKNNFKKEFFNYSFFGFLGTFGSYLAINNYTVGEFLGMKYLAVYSIIYALISLISIPQLGVFNVSAPFINEYLEKNEFDELDRLHKKTSLTLLFIGCVLFACIIVGFPYLVPFFKKDGAMLAMNQPVIWLWGMAVILDLATGFNGNIISLSKYYRINIYTMLLLALLCLGMNYYFTHFTQLKLIGIAISTAVSLSIYNAVKLIFNYKKFQVHPFSIEMVYTAILCLIAVTVAIILPEFDYDILNLICKPLTVLFVIFFGNMYLKIFPMEKIFGSAFLKNIIKVK